MIMKFFGNYISKCTYLMNERTHVSAYRLLSRLSVPVEHPVDELDEIGLVD